MVCVNIRKGGELGGNSAIWTKEAVLGVAKLYKSRKDFQYGHNGACQVARKKGWMDEVSAHMDPPGSSRVKWTLQTVRNCASLCTGRNEFRKRFGNAYEAARRNGWLDEACSHMNQDWVKWTIEKVRYYSEQCSSRGEFRGRFPNAYSAARRSMWLYDVCLHMKPSRNKPKFDMVSDEVQLDNASPLEKAA